MKKRILSFVLTLCMLVSMLTIVPMTANAVDPEVWDGSVADDYASGTGTELDPYMINTAAQLAYFEQQVNSGATTTGVYFKLGSDIVLNEGDAADWADEAPDNEFLPIGINRAGTADATFRAYAFNGTFDGNGKTISGFYVDASSAAYKDAGTGLFAIIGTAATVKNFAIVNSYVKSNNAVGVIGLALCDGFLIDSIYSEIIAEGANHIGGIVGQLSGTGGSNAIIQNCVFKGSATASAAHAGGILGNGNGRNIKVENCLNAGSVYAGGSAKPYSAGIVGRDDNANCFIKYSVNIGVITGSEPYEIGTSGSSKKIVIQDCYYTGANPAGNENATSTRVTKVALTALKGTDATVTITGWTKRANDVMIPTTIYTLFNPEIVVPLNVPSVGDTYASGNGNTASPYIISTATQLVNFSERVNAGYDLTVSVKLGANITLNTGDASTWATTPPANVFNPIGVNTTGLGGVRDYAFCGTFDGDGHTISGLYVNVSDVLYNTQGAGLFGIIGTTAVIKDFAVVNSYVKSNRAVGVIGLALADGFLVDSIYSDIIADGTAMIGGIVGQVSGTSGDSATISNCLFAGSVKATKDGTASASGGILGNGNGKFVQVIDCLNTGSVTGSGNFIAGIVGRNDTTTTITNCINIGDIVQTGTSLYTAGIWTGTLGTGKTITMTNCHSTGNTLYINSSTTGTITPTNVGYFTEKFLGAGASTFTGWTARTGDIMVPAAVAGYVATDILYEFSTFGGAAVRLDNPTGIRFSGAISKAYLDSLKAANTDATITYGMIIAPTAYVTEAGEFTIEALDTAEKTYKIIEAKSTQNSGTAAVDGYYKFNCVLSNIIKNDTINNYTREFSAISYIKIVDGANITYIYADTSTSRSIDVVANAALADLSDTQVGEYQNAVTEGEITRYSPYTDTQRGTLSGFTTGTQE